MPVRIQRRRTKGWRMPPGAIYVGRPSFWANPLRVGIHGDATECVRLYELLICQGDKPSDLTAAQLAAVNAAWPDHFHMPSEHTARSFLRGHDLMCWCPLDAPCHADVLLELANA